MKKKKKNPHPNFQELKGMSSLIIFAKQIVQNPLHSLFM